MTEKPTPQMQRISYIFIKRIELLFCPMIIAFEDSQWTGAPARIVTALRMGEKS
jgi:hypothetical protein